jgi:hypothetical protein
MSEISKDPHHFTLRQNRATSGVSCEAELAQLHSLHEMEEMNIIAEREPLNCLLESP